MNEVATKKNNKQTTIHRALMVLWLHDNENSCMSLLFCCFCPLLLTRRRVNNVAPIQGHGTMTTTWYDSLMPRYFHDVVLTTRDNNNNTTPCYFHDVVKTTSEQNNKTTPCYYHDVVITTRHHKVLVSSLPPSPHQSRRQVVLDGFVCFLVSTTSFCYLIHLINSF